MIRAKNTDKDLIVNILLNSFDDNKSVRSVKDSTSIYSKTNHEKENSSITSNPSSITNTPNIPYKLLILIPP